MCEKTFTSIGNLQRHNSKCAKKYQYKCKECPKVLLNKKQYEKHIRQHDVTTKKFIQKKNRNEVDDSNNLLIQTFFFMDCDLCSTKFQTYTDMKRHYKTVHKKAGYLLCCDKKYTKLCRILEHCAWHQNPDIYK